MSRGFYFFCKERCPQRNHSTGSYHHLNNAVKAYNDKRENYDIEINLDSINNSYRIEISNPIEKSVLAYNSRLKTSKTDVKNHGLGIKSVKRRAEKYNGNAEFTEENNRFVARVWLRPEE